MFDDKTKIMHMANMAKFDNVSVHFDTDVLDRHAVRTFLLASDSGTYCSTSLSPKNHKLTYYKSPRIVSIPV